MTPCIPRRYRTDAWWPVDTAEFHEDQTRTHGYEATTGYGPVCSKSKLSDPGMSEPAPACPYCREPLKRAFTIAPSEGQPEMLVLYCTACKHVETLATTSLRPTLNQPRACPDEEPLALDAVK